MNQELTKVSKDGGISDDETNNLLHPKDKKKSTLRNNRAFNRYYDYYDESPRVWYESDFVFHGLVGDGVIMSWGFHFEAWLPQRLMICFMAQMGFFCLYLLRCNLSIAIIAMTANYTVVENGELHTKVDFNWSMKEQGFLHSAFFYGYIITQIPGGYLANRFGGRRMFGISILSASFVTFLTPFLAKTNFVFMILARFVCGLCEGPSYPAMHSVWSRWCPPNERSRLAAVAFAGAYFGTAVSFATGVGVITSIGWEGVFYYSAIVSSIWSVVWIVWGGETPEVDPYVCEDERRYILDSIGPQGTYKTKLRVPWSDILLSKQVWAINICHFSANWGFYTLMTLFPRYVNDGLKYELNEQFGFIAWPFLLMGFSTMLGGFLSDLLCLLTSLGTTSVRKLMICLPFLLEFFLFIVVAYADLTPIENTLCFLGIMGAMGLSWSGFGVNHLDIAPDYAGVLLGMSNMIATLPGIISPTLTGFIIEDTEDIYGWSIVFSIMGYVVLVALVFYACCGSGERQPWSDSGETINISAYQNVVEGGEPLPQKCPQ